MDFQIKILIISFIITVILSLIIIPILRKLKVGQIERKDGPKSHFKKQGTPTMGGTIMMLSIIICTFIIYLYYKYIGNLEVFYNLIPLVLLALGVGVVGFIDDFKKLVLKNTKGLRPMYKLFGLLIVSVAYVVFLVNGLDFGTETYIPILKIYINIPMYIFIPFIIFILLATTNAINLTDGTDGLSSSVSIIIITCLTVIGILLNVEEIVAFGSILIGTILGFLMFNLNPAKVFMGDTGSLLIGGVIAAMAIYLKVPLLLILIALIPVLETVSVILQVSYFKRTGKRIFKMAPLHHHFELCGWRENKIVIVFSLVTLVLCIIGICIV